MKLDRSNLMLFGCAFFLLGMTLGAILVIDLAGMRLIDHSYVNWFTPAGALLAVFAAWRQRRSDRISNTGEEANG